MTHLSQPTYGMPTGARSHRGVMILVFGILSWVLCFIFGIVAWIMGNNAFKCASCGAASLRCLPPTGGG